MASSTVRVANNAFTLLGTGTLQIQALDFDVYIVIAASLPAATAVGFVASAGAEQPDFTLTTASNIYARATSVYSAQVAISPTT